MPESSAEATKAPEQKGGTEDKKVPLAALSEQRAKTRAANEQAEALQAELEKANKGGQLDLASLSPLVADLMLEARKAAEQEFEPLRQEVAKFKLANQLGLSEPQVDKVMAVKQKNPGLSDQEALLLARSANADLFPQAQPAWNRALHGGLPVSGASEVRNEKATDHTAKMNEAYKKGDIQEARLHAHQAFAERFYQIKPHLRPRST
jgi:hypothetical protein